MQAAYLAQTVLSIKKSALTRCKFEKKTVMRTVVAIMCFRHGTKFAQCHRHNNNDGIYDRQQNECTDGGGLRHG